jgi:hypothetical protein
MLQELQQPRIVDVVEEASDVRIQNPVHLLLANAHVKGVQGAVSAPSGTEAVTESPEVHFVDAFEHRPRGLLDDFVFQCRDSQWPHLAIELGNPAPLGRLRAIRAAVDSRVQISDPPLEVHGVRIPGHTVDARCGLLLQFEEARLEQLRRDVVQQIGVPHLSIT